MNMPAPTPRNLPAVAGGKRPMAFALFLLGAAPLFLLLPGPMALAGALGIFCIVMWATGALPEYWTALAFFAAAIMLEAAPARIVLSGFHSSTIWLLFGGMVLGSAIRHTGLDRRAAALLSRLIGRRYAGILAAIALFSLALAFVMPTSMGRIVLLVPIVTALADHLGYGPEARARTGMLLAAVFATCLPAYSILPANMPNMVLAGAAETLAGTRIGYWDYLLLHFPVLGGVKTALIVLLILRLYPDRDPDQMAAPAAAPPMSAGERHLALVLGGCLLLWLGDGLHHVSPGWVALAAALYCLWPGMRLTPPDCVNREINYATLFFVAGILGLGTLIAASGLGAALVSGLSPHLGLSPGRPVWNVLALTGMASLVGLVTNLPGIPAVMTPGAEGLALATGLPLATILMTQVLAFSNVFLPYQAPPLVSAIQIGGLPAGGVARLCLLLFLISTLLLIPLDLLWWRVLGFI